MGPNLDFDVVFGVQPRLRTVEEWPRRVGAVPCPKVWHQSEQQHKDSD